MADRLAFRNMTGEKRDEGNGEAYGPARRDSEYDSDQSGTSHASHDDGNDGTLLVRSTISRDTTHNTPAVDLVDLSKLAAHTTDLLLNARDTVPEGFGPPPPPPPPPGAFPSDPPPGIPTIRRGIQAPPPFPGRPLPGPPPPGPPPPPGMGPNDPQPPIPIPISSLDNTSRYVYPNSILAEMKPGSNLSMMYRDTWSDPTRFASYNWRDTLRITGRRKSESDLGHYREDDDSWISQHLPPNASRTRLVNTWKLAGLNIKQNNSGNLPLKSSNDQPHLGATLARAAEAHLGLDLYGNTQQSMFISYLLDTIEAIRAERNFLKEILIAPRRIRPPPTAAPSEVKPIVLVPKLKILHRVYCKSHMHGHDQTIFEDLPVRVFSERSQDLELSGKTIIRNLAHYYSQNPEISFVIFKEHLCVEDPQARMPWRAQQQRKGQRGSEISPRAERLHVVSDLLQKALDHVALCSEPESRIDSTGAREMAAPYLFLYHHRARLSQYIEKATGVMKQNITVLLDFLQSDYGAEYREADIEFSKGLLTQKHLEKLYRPNEIVIEKSEGRAIAYVVRDWPEIVDKQMKVPCWTWQYDGVSLHRRYAMLTISLPLPEDLTIDKLSFCPIYVASDATINELRKRGRKFWEMKDKYFGCFSGLDDSRRTQTHHHIRVVVDMFTYSRMHSSKAGAVDQAETSRFDQWPRKIPRDKTPDDSMIMLCPPTVFGFMLQEKTWLKLDVNGIHPIEWNKRAFDRLVLNPKTKELITALVEVRIATGRMEDIIGGKGNGLMILLHGGPGTGKTLTAESVAEIAEKPLYRVTCGDIGTKADDVEKYLETILYLGKIWNCVLLLDEADIFLEERTIADLERNSLVSVFLRILEYYDGILIMTSNRVGTFDEAFKSRIQVSLHYEDLSKKSRKTIWSNFIAMLEEGEEDVNINDLESHLEEMASEEMNGRQIRNAMTTARQLALHRKERLQWEHLDQVLKTAREFNQYLKNVQGHTDKQWAREQRLR